MPRQSSPGPTRAGLQRPASTASRASCSARSFSPRFSWLGGTSSMQPTGRANALAWPQMDTTSDLFCLAATRHISMRTPSSWTWTTTSVRQRKGCGTRPASPKLGFGTTWHSWPTRFHLSQGDRNIAGLPLTGRPADPQWWTPRQIQSLDWFAQVRGKNCKCYVVSSTCLLRGLGWFDWLIDWLVDWLIDLIDWLIDCW